MKSWIGALKAHLPGVAPSPLSPTVCPRALNLIRAAVLASSVLLMLPGAWGHSVTAVEFAQLPAGLAGWQRHSLGIYRVCGPLSKYLYSLPAHLAGIRVDYPEVFDSDVTFRREWELGRIFQSQNRERYHNIYRWSRLLPMLVTIVGGCLICEWSTRLFGAWPGILSLCIWCWMPPILAHGALVTSDVLSAVMLLLAARCFWALLLRPSWASAILAGATLGLALATKFTLLILCPCWGFLLIGRALQIQSGGMPRSREQRTFLARVAAFALAILVTSIVIIDALYQFQDVGFCLAQFRSGLSSLASGIDWVGEQRAIAWILRVPMPFPLEFIRGLDSQLADVEKTQPAYLLGWTRLGGWWYWYAVASLFKIPLPVLVVFGLSLCRSPTTTLKVDPILWAGLCLLVPAMEVTLVISTTTGTGTNAAFRYLIPSLALLCVWGGCRRDPESTFIRMTKLSLISWLAINAMVAVPDHLAWQNEFAWAFTQSSGRPVLIGDCLDWGQDLARLSDWVSRHSGKTTTLIYVYGMGGVEPYGLRVCSALPTTHPSQGPTYLAISQNVLFGYQGGHCVSVGGKNPSMDENKRAALLRQLPYDYVGRTIKIYCLRNSDDDTTNLQQSDDPRVLRREGVSCSSFRAWKRRLTAPSLPARPEPPLFVPLHLDSPPAPDHPAASRGVEIELLHQVRLRFEAPPAPDDRRTSLGRTKTWSISSGRIATRSVTVR